MNGMGGSEVGSGGTYVKILNGETLHGASGAVRGMDGHGVLVIGAAGAIGGVFGDAGRAAAQTKPAQIVHLNWSIARPISSRYKRPRQGFYGSGPTPRPAPPGGE